MTGAAARAAAAITANRRLAREFRLLELAWPRRLARPAPGQFVMVRAGEGTDPLWRRPLGIHDFRIKAAGAAASLLFQVVGPTTRALAACVPGDRLDLLGPFGHGFSVDERERWLVAGGRGVAPLYFLARTLKQRGAPARVMIGGGVGGHILRAGDLARQGYRVDVATEDGSKGREGLVTDLLAAALDQAGPERRREIVIAACGPAGMLRVVARLARRHRVEAEVSLDTLMACGQGICLGCSVRTRDGNRLACSDGPVFRAEEVRW